MKHARSRRLPLLRALSLLGLGSVWAIACGGPQAPGAAGSVCFRTDDCKDGLACVPTAKGSSKSVCGTDLTDIVAMVDGAPLEAAAGGGAGAGASGGASGAAAGGKAATGGAAGAAGTTSGGAPAGGGSAAGATGGSHPVVASDG